MNTQEFSNQFDILYNNITSNQAPGLDEYEKSVFLTKAQDEILKSYFNPRLNKSMEGFDGNERRQIDFSMVMTTTSYSSTHNSSSISSSLFFGGDNNKKITIASDIMMFINEFVEVTRNSRTVRLVAVPLSYQELNRLAAKPYKRPTHYQAWRIINNDSTSNSVDIVIGPNDTFEKYIIRYIKRPYPIILETLSDGLSINGQTTPYGNGHQACELDPILHEEILQRAVELAKAAFTGDLNSQLALGANSETNMGIIQPSR